MSSFFFFFQAEDGIRDVAVTGVQTCALPICTATLGRPGAGPALALSLVLVAIVCGFTALCYAELASMIPIAGSAYTYTYATMGELIAWIIGWDLILEYAVSNMAVRGGLAEDLV